MMTESSEASMYNLMSAVAVALTFLGIQEGQTQGVRRTDNDDSRRGLAEQVDVHRSSFPEIQAGQMDPDTQWWIAVVESCRFL